MRAVALFLLVVGCGGSGKADPARDASFDVRDERSVADARPGAESCGDGLDGDGDLSVDEGCPCALGEVRSCFRGAARNRSVGVCQDGMQRCMPGVEFPVLSSCDGDTLPSAEQCDDDDSDCDGRIDEGCEDDGGPIGTLDARVDGSDAGSDASSDADAEGDADASGPGGTTSFTPIDWDVARDGRLVRAGYDNETVDYAGDTFELLVECFDAGGGFLGRHSAGTLPLSASLVDVAIAGELGTSIVAWHRRSVPPVFDWENFYVVLDERCAVVRAASALDPELPNTGINREPEVAMTDDGHPYVLYEHQSEGTFRLLSYATDGSFTRAVSMPECAGGALSRHIGLDRTTGNSVVVCELSGGSRQYRRFAADLTPIDAAFVAVPGSGSSTSHSFGAAMNDDGAWVYFGGIYDVPSSSYRAVLDFLPAGGLPPRQVILPNVEVDAFPISAIAVSGDFYLWLHDGADYVVRYTSAGDRVSASTMSGRFELDSASRAYPPPYGPTITSAPVGF